MASTAGAAGIAGSATRIACALLALGFGAADARAEVVGASAEVGAEYDSNVHRSVEASDGSAPAPVGSALGRFVVGWSAADRIGDVQDVAFSLLGAAKAFVAPAARGENIAVVETSGLWRLAVGPRTRLALSGAYYEAIQAGTRAEHNVSGNARDFRSLTPSLRLSRAVGAAGMLSAAGGYRFFTYKPLDSYDFGAPVLGVDYRFATETDDEAAEWEIVVGAGVEWRRFTGTRLLASSCGGAPCGIEDPAGTHHQDLFWTGRVEVTRTATVLVGAGYALHWNDSNSYAHSVVRHVASVRATAPLPFGFYLAGRAELVYVPAAYRVVLAVAGPTGQTSASIDDENRTLGRVELTRDLGTRLQLIGRYTVYLNAFGASNTYRRHTGTLSLAVRID